MVVLQRGHGVSQKACSSGRWGVTGRRNWTLLSSLSWVRDLACINPPVCLLAHRVVWNWPAWALKPDEPHSEVLDSHGKLVKRGTVGLVFGAHCLQEAQWRIIPERVLSPAFLCCKWFSVPFVQTSHCSLCLLCLFSAAVWYFPCFGHGDGF